MTIQRRILIGHLAITAIMLVAVVYSVMSLQEVVHGALEALNSGLSIRTSIEQLERQFGDLLKAKDALLKASGVSTDAENRRFLSEFVTKTQDALASARQAVNSRPDPPKLEALDAFLADAMGTVSTGPGEEAPSQDGAAADPTRHDPPAAGGGADRAGSGPRRNVADAGPPVGTAPEVTIAPGFWSMDREIAAGNEIKALKRWEEMGHTERVRNVQDSAGKAAQLVFMSVIVAGVLALLSTIATVRGVRRPLRRLVSATSAVSAGKFGIAVPVTGGDDDLARLADAFNRMSGNLAQVEKMKADFLSIAAHELRTPLTCILGYTGALRAILPAEVARGEEVERYLDRIDREANLIRSQVSDLLDLGIIEAGQLRLEPVEIMTEGFLVMAGEAFKPIAAEKGIDLAVDVQGVPARIVGDQVRLNQVLLNLLDNAFKYTPSGGRVVLAGRSRGGMLEIEVSDTCPGIPTEQLEIIFEKYARVKSGVAEGQKGTGLGLAVVKGIVTAHGGTITAWSEEGKGCRFTVHLPVRTIAPSARPAEVA